MEGKMALVLGLLTWNVGGAVPDARAAGVFARLGAVGADVVGVALEELAVSAEGGPGGVPGRLAEWRAAADAQLAGFRCAAAETVGCVGLLVYVRGPLPATAASARVFFPPRGLPPNKGAVVCRVDVGGRTVDLAACHLAHDEDKNALRLEQIGAVAERVGECGFIFGDLNFRVVYPRQYALDAVAAGAFAGLLAGDQLVVAMRDSPALQGFREGPVLFPPTYKFDPDSDVYDTSSKQRTPSYTDRIVFCGAVDCRVYESLECRLSDHRPVLGVFDLR